MKSLTDLLEADVGGRMPLWVLIVIALAAAAGIWALCQIGRDNQQIYERIENLRARAQHTNSARGLRSLLRELAILMENEAWHRHHHAAARQIQFYIEGRLSVIDVFVPKAEQGDLRPPNTTNPKPWHTKQTRTLSGSYDTTEIYITWNADTSPAAPHVTAISSASCAGTSAKLMSVLSANGSSRKLVNARNSP